MKNALPNGEEQPDIKNLVTESEITHDTLQSLSHCILPEEMFEKEIAEFAQFGVNKNEWLSLMMESGVAARVFQTREWCNFFTRIVEQHNPYCTIMLKRHYVSTKFIQPQQVSDVIFEAYGYCKHSSCLVKDIRITLHGDFKGTITFKENKVYHEIGELHSRPIVGKDRTDIQDRLSDGHKAYKERVKRMANLREGAVAAGNRSVAGKNFQLFRQIAYEGRIKKIYDTDEITRLIMFSEEKYLQNKDKENKTKIQVSILPTCVMIWNTASMKLFHNIVQHDIVYWDATGKIVRSTLTKKNLFYYELTARHPVDGCVSVPLSIMLSDSHTVPDVENWLRRFRHYEKEIYCARNLSMPIQINSDRSMVFILAALHVINNEELPDFLDRAWKIVNGQANTEELMKMNVHACAFHFMRDVKNVAKKHFNSKDCIRFAMWSCSLLMNANNMKSLEDIFSTLVRICHIKSPCDQLTSGIRSLNEYIETFDFNMKENGIHVSTGDLEDVEVDFKDRRRTEKDILEAAMTSPFRKHFQKLNRSEKEKLASIETNETINIYYRPTFIEEIIERFIGTVPLWSGLLLGNLTRHCESAAYMKYKEKRIFSGTKLADNFKNFTKDNRTIGVSERRMGVLFNQQLVGTIKMRLDDFVREVHEDLVGIQRIFADQFRERKKKQLANSILLEEKWDKKRKGFSLVSNKGYFQKSPNVKEPIKMKAMKKQPTEQKDPFKSKRAKLEEKYSNIDLETSSKECLGYLAPSKVKKEVIESEGKCRLNIATGTNLSQIATSTSFPQGASRILIQQFKGLPNKRNNCWLNAIVQALSSCSNVADLLELQLVMEKTTASFTVLELVEIQSRSFGKRFVNESLIENCLCHLSRNFGVELPFGRQNDASFLLCKMLEEISAIDNTQFGLRFSEISTCFECGQQEEIKENTVDNVIILPALKDKSTSELIQLAFSDLLIQSEEKELACSCGKVAKKDMGK